MIDIKVTNSFKELASFPITQHIKLVSNVQFDTKGLSDHIILFRVLPEKGLVNLAEPYTYTLSYIKESFDTVQINIEQSVNEDGTYTLDVQPIQPLHLNSTYILYVTKELAPSVFHTVKVTSKSSSSLEVNTNGTKVTPGKSYTVTVVETSKDFSTKNTVKFDVNGTTFDLDLKRTTEKYIEDIKLVFKDTIYVAGESFSILVKEPTLGADDQLISIKTAQSSTILPMEGVKPSQTIDTQAILDFYTAPQKVKVQEKVSPTYLSRNAFSVQLPEGFIVNTDSEVIYAITEAFGNYLITDLGLYEYDQKYMINMYQEDDLLFIEVHASDEDIVLFNDEEILSSKMRRVV